MSVLSIVILIVLVLLLLGSFPGLGMTYNASWGYRPMGVIGTILVIVVVLLLLRVI